MNPTVTCITSRSPRQPLRPLCKASSSRSIDAATPPRDKTLDFSSISSPSELAQISISPMAYRCIAHKRARLSGGSVGSSAGGGRGYGGPDRISRLPDELLHHVLSFVTTPEAVRTSALSRRWVGVWKRVPRLHLLEEEATKAEHIPDHYDGILRRYAADVDIADLAITYHWDWPEVDGDRASAWAGFAARRVTGRFDLAVTSQVGRGGDDDERAVLDLPCFERATEISLYSSGLAVRLPAELDAAGDGDFTRLTKLQMSELRFSDAGEGISGVVSRRCPSLDCLDRARAHRRRGGAHPPHRLAPEPPPRLGLSSPTARRGGRKPPQDAGGVLLRRNEIVSSLERRRRGGGDAALRAGVGGARLGGRVPRRG
ncbi:Os07g0546800 [Oryza sativa Japonica Group]|uniref:Os07g0546800 protein n=1 Tax=Oryza sativa subsp. japonica TaxID=39947 RepID=A0A0P0X734_ORYSJ|nr:hypothetical protein EE612_039883 [Oryza sativa]BAT02017.1 Os07g0546800 [Oryza sativa Japonica Group]